MLWGMRVVAGTIFFPRGGSAYVARALARELDEDVTLVAGSTADDDARAFYAGIDVRPVDFTAGDAPMHGSFEDRPGAHDRVFAALDDDEYARHVAAWARALHAAGAAGADVLHLHHLTPLHAAAAAVAPGVPVVTHLHGTELLMLEAIAAGASWPYGVAWAARLRAWAQGSARVVAAPGNVERATALLGLAPERVVALPNGVDTTVFHPREVDRAAVWRRALPDAPGVARGPVVLYVGRFTEVKRIPLLIEAFAAARARMAAPASLVLVGGHPGEWEGEHPEATVDRLDVDGVHLAGWHAQQDLPDLLAASDLLALASAHEGFGQVVVEAMACGTPPVVARSEGPAELVEDGATGWVVAVDDAAALAAALADAVARPDERARRGRRAAQVARERYAWPVIAAGLRRVLAAAAGRRGHRTATSADRGRG
jgi:glycosyltransferase involved in cell wall biosynthesis